MAGKYASIRPMTKKQRESGLAALRRAIDMTPGKQRGLAASIGVHRKTMMEWFERDEGVPVEYCPKIEAATGGAVRRQDLRPDFAWIVETAKAS